MSNLYTEQEFLAEAAELATILPIQKGVILHIDGQWWVMHEKDTRPEAKITDYARQTKIRSEMYSNYIPYWDASEDPISVRFDEDGNRIEGFIDGEEIAYNVASVNGEDVLLFWQPWTQYLTLLRTYMIMRNFQLIA